MGEIFDDLHSASEPPQRVWAAKVANNPSDFSEILEVVIPGLDSGLRWRTTAWQSRDSTSMPVRGNRCLVIFDDDDEIWVVAWTPF